MQLRDGRVISRPIAGTRRRGRDEQHDKRLAAELVEHPKERAEHVMLVDLARNDVGRVVRFGTERVEELMTLERYSHVMHLTSQVAGDLAAGKTPVDVLRATFPAGHRQRRAEGARDGDHRRARTDEAGPVRRASSAIVDFSGNLDTAIAIRTMVWRGEQATLQAGAGIVADSDPADEDLECRNKAQALLTAAAAARRLPPLARRSRGTRGPSMSADRRATTSIRGVVTVTGPDAGSFLQSLLSQDLDPIAVGAGRAGAAAAAAGQAHRDAARVARRRRRVVVHHRRKVRRRAGRRPEPFRIRVKADIVDVVGRLRPWLAVRGDDAADRRVDRRSAATRDVDRDAAGASDIVGPRASDRTRARAVARAAGVAAGSHDEYEAARIAAGVPRLGVDIDERDDPAGSVPRRSTRCRSRRVASSVRSSCAASTPVVTSTATCGECTFDTARRDARRRRGGGRRPGRRRRSRAAPGREALAMVRREVEPPADGRSCAGGDDEVAGRVEAL